MKKTLGGDRLGAGKKMQVDLHGYGRSSHDLGYLWRSTMSAGTLVPFMSELALPGDTFDINLDCDIKTHPTIGPLFGSFKVQLDVFQCPIRLYQGALHNNKLGIGLQMSTVKLPVLRFTQGDDNSPNLENYDSKQMNPSCIFNYLGIRGIGYNFDNGDVTRDFNAIPFLSYWDIYKNYYASKQEQIGAVVHTPEQTFDPDVDEIQVFNPNPLISAVTLTQFPTITLANIGLGYKINIVWATTGQPLDQIIINTNYGEIRASDFGQIVNQTAGNVEILYDFAKYGSRVINSWKYVSADSLGSGPINVQTFALSSIDLMREDILAQSSIPIVIDAGSYEPYSLPFLQSSSYKARLQSQEGLAIKTYQSDLFNNWLNTEWLDGTNGINEITSIDTSGGSFTIDTLRLANKVNELLNRIAVSGGTYDDWLDAVYTNERYKRAESPIYHGGLIKELVFQEVISNTESPENANGVQPLGSLAGRGVLGKKHKGGNVTIRVDEPSYIIGIVSITPRIDYSQGNKWDVHLKTMDDLHKPALDEIGFQELLTEQMAWWSTYYNGTSWITPSAGKQPAWLNYMTNVNRVYGNFAELENENFMVLTRKYQASQDADHLIIDDLTTYIDPSKYNVIFAQTSLDSQNFWTQIAVDIEARRKISAKLIPNL